MSVGFTLTKADIDARAGGLVVAVRDALARCAAFNALLNDTGIIPDNNFLTTTLSPGYTSGEVTTLRAAFVDLSKLNDIAHAAATQAAVNDFFFNAKKLTGTVLT
jgi:hypothetical protein